MVLAMLGLAVSFGMIGFGVSRPGEGERRNAREDECLFHSSNPNPADLNDP
jgi:hypothetical protein